MTGPERYFARINDMLQSPLLDTPGSRRLFLSLERTKWLERERALASDPNAPSGAAFDYAATITQLAALEKAQ